MHGLAGSNGASTAHSASVRSLAKGSPSRICCARVVAVHMGVLIQFGLDNLLKSRPAVTTQPLSAEAGPMHRIYFDTNEGDQHGRYNLGIPGALEDIEAIADQLFEGLKVIIYMGNELEMEAVLVFDARSRNWMDNPIAETTKYPT